MKKKINDIVEEQGRIKDSCPREISKSAAEVEFFLLLRTELKKTGEYFSVAEQIFGIRYQSIQHGFSVVQDTEIMYEKNAWTRLLLACVKFYKDLLLLENFAVMNYCGFSKILKKHDKMTGFSTRESFMNNVMAKQNFTNYPAVSELMNKSEFLFSCIQERYAVI